MRFYPGTRLVDLLYPRLSLRRLAWLIRGLPSEALAVKAEGGHGFSTLELAVMENGVSGTVLNPRHPWAEAEATVATGRKKRLQARTAYYAAQRQAQASVAQRDDDEADQPDDEDHSADQHTQGE